MIIELQRFVEFKESWYGPGNETREHIVCEPMLINTDYIGTVRRIEFSSGIEMVEIHMVDRGCDYRCDITYEEMRKLLMQGRQAGVEIK